jgi:intracellular septation protein A
VSETSSPPPASSSTGTGRANVLSRLGPLLRFAATELGPLIVFSALAAIWGTKAAIGGAVVFIIVDALRRFYGRIPATRLYIFSSILTLLFGAIDLLAVTPFMLKYEAVITNLATGAAFVIGARGAKPMLQELAEKQQNTSFPDGVDVRRFFQIFTLLWAVYFVLKAALYYWLGSVMPLAQAITLRSIVGGASLLVMIYLSTTQGRRLFQLCRRLGLLPQAPERQNDA